MQKLAPVFDSDTRNAFKLAEIVCDDDQSAATGMASNHLVIRPDPSTTARLRSGALHDGKIFFSAP